MESRGTLIQDFKIRLDVEALAQYIVDKVITAIGNEKALNNVELDEAYFEDDELIMNGSYKTDYKSTYYPATRECPAEFDIEREYIGDGEWILSDLPDEIKKLVSVFKVEEDEDKVSEA